MRTPPEANNPHPISGLTTPIDMQVKKVAPPMPPLAPEDKRVLTIHLLPNDLHSVVTDIKRLATRMATLSGYVTGTKHLESSIEKSNSEGVNCLAEEIGELLIDLNAYTDMMEQNINILEIGLRGKLYSTAPAAPATTDGLFTGIMQNHL